MFTATRRRTGRNAVAVAAVRQSLGLRMTQLRRALHGPNRRFGRTPAPVQFGPYVQQRIDSKRTRLEADREYWRATLAGARPMPLAPGLQRDWSRPPSTTWGKVLAV